MNFLNAIKCLESGQPVRRKCWGENCYLALEDNVFKVKAKLNEYISTVANDAEIDPIALNADDWEEYYELMTFTEAFEDFLAEDKFKIMFKDLDGEYYTIVKRYEDIVSFDELARREFHLTKQELQNKSFYAV